MKFKLSKTSWLLLAAGIFIVLLAGLGMTRTQQIRQQTELDDALVLTTSRLDKFDVGQLELEEAELQQRLNESTAELEEVKERLHHTVASVDVTDEFFRIAEYSNVEIMNFSTSGKSVDSLGTVACLRTDISASVQGDTPDLIDFVINLNNGFTTGIIKAVNITIRDTEGVDSSASINLTIYSYEGS
jgi:hypothetical protein